MKVLGESSNTDNQRITLGDKVVIQKWGGVLPSICSILDNIKLPFRFAFSLLYRLRLGSTKNGIVFRHGQGSIFHHVLVQVVVEM
jgi:hypothetical protein